MLWNAYVFACACICGVFDSAVRQAAAGFGSEELEDSQKRVQVLGEKLWIAEARILRQGNIDVLHPAKMLR